MAKVIITDLSEATIQRYGGWNVATPTPAGRPGGGQRPVTGRPEPVPGVGGEERRSDLDGSEADVSEANGREAARGGAARGAADGGDLPRREEG